MGFWYFLFICIIFIVSFSVGSAIHKRRVEKVILNSEKIKKLREINDEHPFEEVKIPVFYFSRKVESKKKFDFFKYDDALRESVLTSYEKINANLSASEKNKINLEKYQTRIQKIPTSGNQLLAKKLKMPLKRFLDIEEEEFEKLVLHPTTSISLSIFVEYTSPAGRNHYENIEKYYGDTLRQTIDELSQKSFAWDVYKVMKTSYIAESVQKVSPSSKVVTAVINVEVNSMAKLGASEIYFLDNEETDVKFVSRWDNNGIITKVQRIKELFVYAPLIEDPIQLLEEINSIKKAQETNFISIITSALSPEVLEEITRNTKVTFSRNREGILLICQAFIGLSDAREYLEVNKDSVFHLFFNAVKAKLDEINKIPLYRQKSAVDNAFFREGRGFCESRFVQFEFMEEAKTILTIDFISEPNGYYLKKHFSYIFNNIEIDNRALFFQYCFTNKQRWLLSSIDADFSRKEIRYFSQTKLIEDIFVLYSKYSSQDGVELKISDRIAQNEEWRRLTNYKPSVSPIDLSQLEKGTLVLSEKLELVMRDYQKECFEWCNRMVCNSLNGIIADDMGLGKTLEIIALIEADTSNLPNLIVCPASLSYNWEDEFRKWAPHLQTQILRASSKGELLIKEEPINYIITYNLMSNRISDLAKYKFHYLILDEAQFIKNANAKRAKSAKILEASHRFALTGTPIENKATDLWSIFEFLMPSLFETYKIELLTDEYKRFFAKPFILRRTKDKVLKELPTKNEIPVLIEMNPEQRKYYDDVKASIVDINDEYMRILTQIMRLRQLCISPKIIDQNYDFESVKVEQTLTLIQTIISEKEKVLVFSSFVGALEVLGQRLNSEKIHFSMLIGEMNIDERKNQMGKFKSLEDVSVFLISLKAGGTGLNLTEANNVIILDPWWNVSAENQAIDRAHRIGQNKNVTIYKLICADSIEEKVIKLQKEKKEIFDFYLADSGAALPNQYSLSLLKDLLEQELGRK